jgi:hypothetical protein
MDQADGLDGEHHCELGFRYTSDAVTSTIGSVNPAVYEQRAVSEKKGRVRIPASAPRPKSPTGARKQHNGKGLHVGDELQRRLRSVRDDVGAG